MVVHPRMVGLSNGWNQCMSLAVSQSLSPNQATPISSSFHCSMTSSNIRIFAYYSFYGTLHQCTATSQITLPACCQIMWWELNLFNFPFQDFQNLFSRFVKFWHFEGNKKEKNTNMYKKFHLWVIFKNYVFRIVKFPMFVKWVLTFLKKIFIFCKKFHFVQWGPS